MGGVPVERLLVTLGTAVPPHRDRRDDTAGCIICWAALEAASCRGQFVLHDLLLKLEPRPGCLTLLYLLSQKVTHGTSAPPSDAPTAYMVGMALVNNQHDMQLADKVMNGL